MSFVPRGGAVDATVAVVALGVSERLRTTLDAVVAHRSRAAFDVVCVINPAGRLDSNPGVIFPPGVEVIWASANLGWAGGLHAARQVTEAPFLAWVQDDCSVLDGWLDALIDAATVHPDGATFGVLGVDEHGNPDGFSGGSAGPHPDPGYWNESDPWMTGEPFPTVVTRRDWVTSKGMLSRLAAWDEVGGPCAAQYPLNHVDKEYCTHVRAHGWNNYVVPAAQVLHLQSASAPGAFREFLAQWHAAPFHERWGAVVDALADGAVRADHVPHHCHRHDSPADVLSECAGEAMAMLVPFARFTGAREHRLREEADAALAHVHRELVAAHDAIAAMRESPSWRLTRPLRGVARMARSLRGRSDSDRARP